MTARDAASALRQLRMHLEHSFFGSLSRRDDQQALWSEIAPVEVKSLSRSASMLPTVGGGGVGGSRARPTSRWATSDSEALQAERTRFKAGLTLDPTPANPPSRAIIPVKSPPLMPGASTKGGEGASPEPPQRLSTPRLEAIVAQFTTGLSLPDLPVKRDAVVGGSLASGKSRLEKSRRQARYSGGGGGGAVGL